MKNNLIQIVVALILVVLLVLLSDPFMFWMPPMALMLCLLAVAVIMSIWAGFVLKESTGDEREDLHRMNAGRTAYLIGLAVLTLALVLQGFSHQIDPWIALAIAAMVLSKLFSRIYFEKYR